MARAAMSPPYEVRPVPGKGLGAVAARSILPGEAVASEAPLVEVGLDDGGDLLGVFRENGEFVCPGLDRALLKLPDSDLKRFFSLCDSVSGGKNSSKTRYGIVKTNSFCVKSATGAHVLAVFPGVARINHSCLPNCHHYWSPGRGHFVVRAARTLSPGEEITISYMSPLQRRDFHDRDSRRRILSDEFGFVCGCDLCLMPAEDSREEDDAKRRRVLEIETAWSDLGGDPGRAFDLAREQMRLCEDLGFQPGLLSYVALHCVEAASLLVEGGGNTVASETLEHAKTACAHAAVAYGIDSSEMEIFRSIVVSCEKEPSSGGLVSAVQGAIAALRDIQ